MNEYFFRRPALALAVSLFLAWWLWGKSYPVICNDGSRLATIESLVHRGSFEISDSMFIDTCDKIRVPPQAEKGQYFSDKPPLYSILGAGIYKGMHAVGFDLRDRIAPVYRTLTFFLTLVPVFLMIFFIHLYLDAKKIPLLQRWWLYTACFLGTLIFPYLMVINNHVPAAALLLGAYIFIENPMRYSSVFSLSIAGLCLGLGIAIELCTAFFFLAFSVWILWTKTKENPRAVFCYLASAGIPILVTWLLFRFLSGQWLPFVAQPQNYLYPGSIVPESVVFGGTGFFLPPSSYLAFLFHGSVGYRGVFSHSAVLILGFIGLWKMAAQPGLSSLMRAILYSIIMMTAFLTVLMPISYGGSNFGFRYMILWMPLVALMAHRLFLEKGISSWMKVVVLISVFTASSGVPSPWLIHSWNPIQSSTFDFISVYDSRNNPYALIESSLSSFSEKMEKLKKLQTKESFLELAHLYYQLHRPSEALGTLQILGERFPQDLDWHCYTALIFSDEGLRLKDLMKRHQSQCPEPTWKTIETPRKNTGGSSH